MSPPCPKYRIPAIPMVKIKENYTESREIRWNSHDQRLEIDLSKMLNRQCVLYIESWGKGIQWHSMTEDVFEQQAYFCDPGLDLLSQTHHPAIAQWASSIPSEILSNVRELRVGRFEMLQMCGQWKEAIDLLKELPMVLWLLHLFSSKHKWPRHIITHVTHSSSTEALGTMISVPKDKASLATQSDSN